MALYEMASWSFVGSYDEVLAAMETKLETVDASNPIYLQDIVSRGDEFVGFLQYSGL